jgi:hypothetical protein
MLVAMARASQPHKKWVPRVWDVLGQQAELRKLLQYVDSFKQLETHVRIDARILGTTVKV